MFDDQQNFHHHHHHHHHQPCSNGPPTYTPSQTFHLQLIPVYSSCSRGRIASSLWSSGNIFGTPCCGFFSWSFGVSVLCRREEANCKWLLAVGLDHAVPSHNPNLRRVIHTYSPYIHHIFTINHHIFTIYMFIWWKVTIYSPYSAE